MRSSLQRLKSRQSGQHAQGDRTASPTPAAIYARISPRRQRPKDRRTPLPATGEPSIQAQIAACRKWCEQKGHAVIEPPCEDVFRGGNEPDRPGLFKALATLPRHGVLVVMKRDRLTRGDPMFGAWLELQCRKRLIRIETTLGEVQEDGDDGLTIMLRRIVDAFSEYERWNICMRTSGAMRFYQSQGRKMSSQARFGYKIEGDREVPEPTEQIALERIKILGRRGDTNPKEIARLLDGWGFKPRFGQKWNPRRIRRILDREGLL